MERDKMIEKMTANGLCCIACEMCDETEENGKFVKAECLESGCTNNCSISKHVAEAFIDAGYRKVPEGAVVLTKEEYEELKNLDVSYDALADQYFNLMEKAGKMRKETAKEILCEFSKLQWGQSELDNVCIRIAEKYGVEVE